MIRKKEVLKKYNISYLTFLNAVSKLPDDVQMFLHGSHNKHFFTGKQITILKDFLGDFNQHPFKSKFEMWSLYGVSKITFKKMLKEALGADHVFLNETKTSNYYTSKHVQLIIDVIGEP